jgi:serine/threonine protein kinase
MHFPSVRHAGEGIATGSYDAQTIEQPVARPSLASASVDYQTAVASALSKRGLRPWNPNRFKKMRQLGKGAFGSVYIAVDAEQSTLPAEGDEKGVEPEAKLVTVVVKEISKSGTGVRAILAEVESLTRLRGQCAEYLLCFDGGFYEDAGTWYLVTKYIKNYVPLTDAAERRSLRSEDNLDRLAQVITNLIQGLKVIHGEKIAHRDVKPANVLVEKDGSGIKYIDFGGACVDYLCANQHLIVGTSLYAAPELFDGTLTRATLTLEQLQRTDIWSLGLLIYELVSPLVETYLVDAWRNNYLSVLRFRQGADSVGIITTADATNHMSASIELFRKQFDYTSPCDPMILPSAQVEQSLLLLNNLYRRFFKKNPQLSLKGMLVRDPQSRSLPTLLF